MTWGRWSTQCVSLVLGGVLCAGCWAEGTQAVLRDPTLPPVSMRAPAVTASGAVGAEGGAVVEDRLPGLDDGAAIVWRAGVPHLVYGTRLYGVGQKIENYRIERITETEVWMRGPSGLKKWTRFADIQRKTVLPLSDECAVAPAAAAPVAAASAPAKARSKRALHKSSAPAMPAASAAASSPVPGIVLCPRDNP